MSMTEKERYCTVYAIPSNRSICVNGPIKKQPLSPEARTRRDYMNNNNFIIYTGKNGEPCLKVEPKNK